MATSNETPIVPPLQIPNRYDTTVLIEYSIDYNVCFKKWFSDIQMAWKWVKSREHEFWNFIPFITVANELDIAWQNDRGVLMASCGVEAWEAYYKPTVNYEDVRDCEEHFDLPEHY